MYWISKLSGKFILALLALSLLLSSCGQSPTAPPRTGVELSLDFKETIGKISRHRNEAENAVLQVKRDSENLTSEQIARAFDLYNSARVEFNAWIDEVKAGLTQDDFNLTAQDNEHLDLAIQKKEQLIDFVRNDYSLSRQSQSVDAFIPIIGEVVDLIIKIWDMFNRADEARRQAMIKALDEQLWKSWDAIE